MQRIANVERTLNNMSRPGTVYERDHEKGVRFKIAEDSDGNPVLTSWVQPPDNNKGKRSRFLPDIGAQALIFTPPGFESAATFVPMSHHEASQNPATDADDTVIFDDGEVRIGVKGGVLQIKAGSSSIVVENGKITANATNIQNNGSSVKHNTKEIGAAHTHNGVTPGLGITQDPT